MDLRGNECSRINEVPPYLPLSEKTIMIHNFQKRWVFTWNADESGHLVDCLSLQNLLNEIAKEGVFQKEKGIWEFFSLVFALNFLISILNVNCIMVLIHIRYLIF